MAAGRAADRAAVRAFFQAAGGIPAGIDEMIG
jgi:hypothetical protein